MNRPSPETKQAALADLKETGQPYHVVAARHGISRSTLHDWVKPRPRVSRKPKTYGADEIALTGGRWVLNSRRVQVWEAW